MRPEEEKGWWGRNWGWFVPLTCLGCLVLPAACIGGCVWMGVSAVQKSLGVPFAEGLAAARGHPVVVEALGEPIEMDWKGFQGNMDGSGDGNRATVSFPVRGPRGRGRLSIEARERNGVWIYDRLEIRIDGRDEPIDLRDHVPRMRDAA